MPAVSRAPECREHCGSPAPAVLAKCRVMAQGGHRRPGGDLSELLSAWRLHPCPFPAPWRCSLEASLTPGRAALRVLGARGVHISRAQVGAGTCRAVFSPLGSSHARPAGPRLPSIVKALGGLRLFPDGGRATWGGCLFLEKRLFTPADPQPGRAPWITEPLFLLLKFRSLAPALCSLKRDHRPGWELGGRKPDRVGRRPRASQPLLPWAGACLQEAGAGSRGGLPSGGSACGPARVRGCSYRGVFIPHPSLLRGARRFGQWLKRCCGKSEVEGLKTNTAVFVLFLQQH